MSEIFADPPTLITALTLAFSVGALGLLVVELVWLGLRRALNWRRVKEMAASYSTLLPAIGVDFLLGAGLVALFFAVGTLSPWSIPVTWWTALLCVLAVDFVYYWEHRIEHRVRVLWALYHSVHHSSPVFDQSTAYRISFVDFFFFPLFFLPLVLLGFDPLLVLVSFGFVLAYQTWIHTESIGRLGILDAIFNTPSNHRVHHGAEPECIDRNYGGFLIVWDRLFGTYTRERETPRYGLVKPIGSANPIRVHVHEAVGLWRDLRQARSLTDALRLLFAPPGTPEQPAPRTLVSGSESAAKRDLAPR